MDISKKRLTNAKLILEELCSGNKSEFARRIEKTPQLVNKWWSGDDKMKRNIGNSSARLIESVFKLQNGWMDEAHSNTADLEEDQQKKVELKVKSGETHNIPLMGSTLLDHQFQLSVINNNKGTLMLLSTDPDAHAFQLVGHNPTPILDNNWGLVVEPNTPLAINEYVLIWLNSGEILLRLVAFQDDSSVVARHPITGEQTKLDLSVIDKAHYCYVGIPPSKINLTVDS